METQGELRNRYSGPALEGQQVDFLRDSIPASYYSRSSEEIAERTFALKRELGERVFILAHYYQRDETFQFGDCSGDSLKLAQEAAKVASEYIVFCGVHFMAESADILTSQEQAVILPNLSAGCSLADMADLDSVEECWEQIVETCGEGSFIPITYVNSSAALKAFCGKHGGTVCTSSNASKILSWALRQEKSVFFFPDQHLGRNSALQLGIPAEDITMWNRHLDDGGLSYDEIRKARVLLWSGFCSVHAKFRPEQIHAVRRRIPGVRVIVHPECSREVVELADECGSTGYIRKVVEEAAEGTSFAIGTEINMVSRLHQELHATQGKHVECLNLQVCPCSTMFRTHPANVLWVLENLANEKVVNRIQVEEPIRSDALRALNLMLKLSS